MTLEGLYCAINAKLHEIKESLDFSKIIVEDEDNDDEIRRPSIRVIIDDYVVEKANFCGMTHTANPEIFYYSSKEAFSNEENIKMQGILEELFINGVDIDGVVIEPERLEFQKEPGMLYCKLINMTHTTYNVEETGEEIETLELGMEV